MRRVLFLLICLPVIGWGQSTIVSGNVSDNIDIVPGVNVIEKGTTNGTTTDFNGNYEISVSSNTAILVFSYVGYASQDITVGEQRTINVTLAENTQALDAVLVKGFTGVVGKARKRTESIQDIPESYDKEVMQQPALHQFKTGTLEYCGVSPVNVTYISTISDSSVQFRKEWLNKICKLGETLA